MLAANGKSYTPPPMPQFGSAKGLITIRPEFDEPLEDFKPYLERSSCFLKCQRHGIL